MEIAISGYPWVYTSQSLLGRGERIRGRDRKYSVHEETGERWNEAVERVRGETNKRRKREGEESLQLAEGSRERFTLRVA